MFSSTNEQALEKAIEKALTGYCSADKSAVAVATTSVVEDSADIYRMGKGFYVGNSADFNAQYAIDEVRFWHFLETTQKESLEKLKRSPDYQRKVLDRLDKIIKKSGILRVLRKGIDIEDVHLTLFYQSPMASSSLAVKENFEKNEFSVTRQVHYHLSNTHESIDMVLFVNGLPLLTMELKNPWTGQYARIQGISQYKKNRDPKQPLLQFARCLVHFAVDTDEVYMCTKLDGDNSFFLPFNKGNGTGKGNPPNPLGHKSSYLWEEVFSRSSLANIIQHFVLLSGSSNDALGQRTLYFPRYHQLDVVRKLVADTAQNGVGRTYLIHHSAGSGKSNSITWAAYQLIEVYAHGAKSLDRPLFDSVIVVTDRRLLDKQLRDNIKEFSENKHIIAAAHSSVELKKALEGGKRIIITTIQKFPFIIDGISDLSDRRFAVIIDEAHSSQGGMAAASLNQAMGTGRVAMSSVATAEDDEEEIDVQDLILRTIQSRKMKSNASYMAFTATPKNSTLERFGTPQSDGTFLPFHLYSMKQAIEEGFILDVLANYTTYKSYYEIEKSVADNPLFDTHRAQKKLRNFVERDKRTIANKAEIMLEHFLNKVYNGKKLKGKAKAMVVTQSIESAIQYYFALKRLLEAQANPFKIAIAFSGKKTVEGIEYTESVLNGFDEKDTSSQFASDEYRLLVVANKYLTGFDQPKLCAMYVDKKLQDVLAVQCLSRLNRAANKLGKRTEDLFVLDFFNEVADIKQAFDRFYTSTSLSEPTDVNVLHELREHLDNVGVYEWSEVEMFIEKYFTQAEAQELDAIITVPAERFNVDLALSDDQKADFKIKAKQFVKIYAQIAAIIPYEVLVWEKLFWFLKFLIPKLLVKTQQDAMIDELLESVDLSTYGLERTQLNHSIALDEANAILNPQNANPRGAHGSEVTLNPLDEIVRAFNERWFQAWEATPEDQREKFVKLSKHVQSHPDYSLKVLGNNDPQTQDLALKKILDEVMNQQRRQELELYKLYQEDAFRQDLLNVLKRQIGITTFPQL
ncbi:MAG: type I restriction endonuclease subunit R [Chitinophagales bacterium]|nr:type I restriction endonuclease subunit R [Chitinophagales bacterium]